MSTTKDRLRAEQRRAQQSTVITVLSAAPLGLPEDDILVLLEKARAAKGIALRELAGHLVSHPDALSSGDPRCPAVLIRLVYVLHDAGHAAVVRPGCSGCGKITHDLVRSGPDGRLCQMCAVHASLGTCARCGRQDTRIAARRTEGGICYPCYRVDGEVVEECGRCGRIRMPVTRLDDGTPLCLGCWTPPTRRCDLCGQDAPATLSGPDEVVCRDCYRRQRQPRRACGRCDRIRPIAKRAVAGAPDLCGTCNLGPDMVCAGCGRTRPSRRRKVDNAWYCNTCKPKTIENCARCGRTKPIQARWPLGPLCTTCHSRILDTPTNASAAARSTSWSPATSTTRLSAARAPESNSTPAARPADSPAATIRPANARAAPWTTACATC